MRELCHSLKKNKAAGWDLVTGEHMIYGRDTLYNILALGNRHLWHILWNYYQGFTCSVQVAGGQSKWFVAEQGVHQGGPFSMKLYTVCNSYLLSDLESGRHGAQLSIVPTREYVVQHMLMTQP